jgi:DNA-binding transcriptional LysR family regulator
LKIFKSVVENQGFSSAQAELNISAASISVQMKELEEQLGMILCERGRTGFKVTERGLAVYEATRGLFASMDNFNLEIANIRSELSGEIRIGLQDNVSTNPDFKLAKTLDRFHQRSNSVLFRLEEAASSEQESRTLEGRYNLAIGIFHQRLPGLTYHKLFDERVVLYCAKGHPLFADDNRNITLEELTKHRFASTGLLQKTVQQDRDFNPQAHALAENMDAMALLLLSGHYLGYLPEHFARTWVERGEMRALLSEQSSGSVAFHTITKRGVLQPFAVETFIQDLLYCHHLV